MLCISCAADRVRPYFMALPTHIDPRKLALQGYLLEGEVAIDSLPRLQSAVVEVVGQVLASVQFELDEARAKIALGVVEAKVAVICQRCLDKVQIDLKAHFAVQVIWSEEHESRVAKNYEPWLVLDKLANLSELLEDEILLSLPLVNYHASGECTGDTFETKKISDDNGTVEDGPFSILSQLKRR